MEKLNVSGITLEGFAQGGVQTSIFIPEVAAMFDVGCMLPFNTDHIFVTHGHPDHMGALCNTVARRTTRRQPGDKRLNIFVPHGIVEHVIAMLEAQEMVFGGKGRRDWHVVGLLPGDVVHSGAGTKVRALRTFHGAPSCGWAVEKTTMKLKPELAGAHRDTLIDMKKKGIPITVESTNIEVVIPGDTMIEFLLREEAARKAKVLLHEVTFWDDQTTVEGTRRFGHTHVDEMIQHCEMFEGEALVLVHRSLKHKRHDVEAIMRRRFPASMLPKLHLFDGGDRQ